MKKTYIKPAMQSFKLQTEMIIALSTQSQSITEENKEDFNMLGREDNGPSAPGVWDSEW